LLLDAKEREKPGVTAFPAKEERDPLTLSQNGFLTP
jgi:hypothetical protein